MKVGFGRQILHVANGSNLRAPHKFFLDGLWIRPRFETMGTLMDLFCPFS